MDEAGELSWVRVLASLPEDECLVLVTQVSLPYLWYQL